DFKVFPYLKTTYLGFMLKHSQLSDRFLRRSISMAIDKSQLIDVLQGRQEKAYSFVPPSVLGHSKKVGLAYSLERARAELKKASFKRDSPLKVDVLLMNAEKSRLVGQVIQNQLKENLGIEVVLQPYDNKTYRAKIATYSYPLFLSSWSADFPDPD